MRGPSRRTVARVLIAVGVSGVFCTLLAGAERPQEAAPSMLARLPDSLGVTAGYGRFVSPSRPVCLQSDGPSGTASPRTGLEAPSGLTFGQKAEAFGGGLRPARPSHGSGSASALARWRVGHSTPTAIP